MSKGVCLITMIYSHDRDNKKDNEVPIHDLD